MFRATDGQPGMLSAVRRGFAISAVFCLVLTTACTLTGQAAPPAKPLHIGVDLPLTGAERRAALPALNGIKFFVQQHPKLDGFDVSVTASDDAIGGRPSANQGVANLEAFLKDPNLVAMIGPFNAGVARKEIPVANAAGLAMITPATTSPCLTKDVFLPAGLNPAQSQISCKDAGLPSAAELRPTHVNNFFRLTTIDPLQGPAAADYAFKTLHILRVATISDHETYGQGLVTAFTGRFQKLGGTVIGHLDQDLKSTPDATTFLQAMKVARAQAVYFGGFEKGCAIRAQMKSVFDPGAATPFMGGDGIALDPACIKDANANTDGILATVPIVNADSQAGARATIKAFTAAYGSTADYGPYTMVAYDATAVLYAAIDRAIMAAGGQLPPRTGVTQEVAATSGLSGVTGILGFDAAGDTTNRVISIFGPASPDPRMPWKFVDAVDYSAALPY
jgi:branched-chain amino acid transport system substrate-binding protein